MSALQDVKRQQIGSLYTHNSAVSVAVEGQLYEIPWSSTEDDFFILVLLPPQFPDEPPVITISPPGTRHPLIKADLIINEGQFQWTPSSNLGILVKSIRDEFNRQPPVKNKSDPSYGPGRPNNSHYSHRPPPAIPSSQSTPVPSSALTNNEYMAVVHTTPEQAHELLTSDYAFDLFFHSLERVQNLKSFQGELRNGNESIAHKNLSRQDGLIMLRSEVEALDEEYNRLKADFDVKEQQQQEAFSRLAASTVLTRLKAGVYECDELSESVAQSFLDGNLNHDEFVKQFREMRKVYHLRASKLERAQKDNLFT
ncbi:hypothetical protein CLU79DRAFT_768662 [Phycomyces nitens]|nr:hypothetical protein CLU79DRAFT_768662 [Phycomyces nitens]